MEKLLKQQGKPNIVLIVIDCGRPDRFSAYGHYRPTTPNIDKLAASGLLFENAYSVDTATPLSHFALMSGQGDWSGRAWLQKATLAKKGKFLWRRILRRLGLTDFVGGYDEDRHSLVQLLKDEGYFTLGLSANHLVSPKTMRAFRGFDAFPEDALSAGLDDDPQIAKALKRHKVVDSKANRQALHLTADRIFDLARQTLAEKNPAFDKPFFFFANLMDCHDPYLVHESFKEDFGFKPNSKFNSDLRNRPLRDDQRWTDSSDLDPQTVDLLRWNYDRCLRFIDNQIGKLVEHFETTGIMEDTVFFITADHGEQLGEGGFFTHSQTATDYQLHIPLILSGGKFLAEGKRIRAEASLVDIRPTIFDLLGKQDPFEHRSGQSLLGTQNTKEASRFQPGDTTDRDAALFGRDRESVSPKELELMEERLRDLGYLD